MAQANNIPLSQTCLLLIDLQKAIHGPSEYFGTSISSAPVSTNVPKLLEVFRSIPATHVMHVQHHSISSESPLHPSKPTSALLAFAQPQGQESLFTKNVNSALVGTKLESKLRERGIRRLVICGLTTDHCVSTTTRMAANLDVVGSNTGGGEILLVGDACAAHEKGGIDAETVHRVHLASLNGEFCKVVSTQDVVEMLKVSE